MSEIKELAATEGGGDAAVPEPVESDVVTRSGVAFIGYSCTPLERATLDALAGAGINSVFTKRPHGWDVKYVEGGVIKFVPGPSIPEAIGSHGQQKDYEYMAPGPFVHPPIEKEPALPGSAS